MTPFRSSPVTYAIAKVETAHQSPMVEHHSLSPPPAPNGGTACLVLMHVSLPLSSSQQIYTPALCL